MNHADRRYQGWISPDVFQGHGNKEKSNGGNAFNEGNSTKEFEHDSGQTTKLHCPLPDENAVNMSEPKWGRAFE